MKASRHNGRSGKHGVYDVKHNDRDFDVENSEHKHECIYSSKGQCHCKASGYAVWY